MADADEFNKKVKLLWLGIGTTEPQRMYEGVKNYHEALEKAGIKHVYYESPGTSHEWLTWRRCLNEFAPLAVRQHAPSVGRRPRQPGQRQPIVLNADDVPAFPEPPGRHRRREGRAARQAGDDLLRLEVRRRDPEDAGLHAAGLLSREEVPGPVPAARHRRRRDRMAALRQAESRPRQPDRRGEGRADDRGHAQRPRREERSARGERLRLRAGLRGVREGPARGRHPRDRIEVFGPGRPRASRPGRPVDGRRPVAQLRPGPPRHVRLGRRLLLGPKHEAARRSDRRSRSGEEAAQAPLGRLREQGQPASASARGCTPI